MEDKLSLSVAKSSAFRFVYRERSGMPVDWNEDIALIYNCVEEIPPLNFANNKTFIQVEGNCESSPDSELKHKIGREVIGHFDLNSNNTYGAKIEDFPVRECFRFNLGEVTPEGFTFERIFSLEEELRREAMSFGEVELPWRIVIDQVFSEDNFVKYLIEIQFFSRKKL